MDNYTIYIALLKTIFNANHCAQWFGGYKIKDKESNGFTCMVKYILVLA